MLCLRDISSETDREPQQLQNYWSEVRYTVRCIYRQAGTPLADDQDQSLVPDKEGVKELVDRYTWTLILPSRWAFLLARGFQPWVQLVSARGDGPTRVSPLSRGDARFWAHVTPAAGALGAARRAGQLGPWVRPCGTGQPVECGAVRVHVRGSHVLGVGLQQLPCAQSQCRI